MNVHEGSSAGTRRDALNARDDARNARDEAVIARLSTLAPALDGEPDPAFRAATRARLVAMAAVRTPESPAVRSTVRPSWRRRLTAGLTTVAVAAAALAVLFLIAAGAGPGDRLYGVKRGGEQTELALTAWRRGALLLHLAGTRLAEVDGLARARTPDAALMLATLKTMDAETADAASWFESRALESHSAVPLDQLSHWTTGQSTGLTTLRAQVPTTVAPAVDHSLALLATTSSRVDVVRARLAPAVQAPAGGKTGSGGGTTIAPPSAPSVGGGGSGTGTGGLPVPTLPLPGNTAGAPSAPSPGSGILPTLPSPGATGVLPPLPVPHASAPGAGLPLPTLPAPSGTAVCVGPLHVGNC